MNIILPRTLRAFLAVLTLLSAMCVACKFICGHVLHLGAPYNYTIVHGALGDLRVYEPIMHHLHQYAFLSPYEHPLWAYPAPVALPYALLFALPHKEIVLYCLILGTFVVAAVFLCRAMLRRGLPFTESVVFLGATFVMAYPIWYEWQAGNTEIFIFILLAVGVLGFIKDQILLAAICIGVAASMKIYPGIFLGLFLARRQYKPLVIAAVTMVALNLFSLAYITPSITYSWHGVGNGLKTYSFFTFRQISREAIGFDHSLFALIKHAGEILSGNLQWITSGLKIYILTIAATGVGLFFYRIRKLPLVNQLLLLTLAAVFLPPSSYDYTLMLLYIPWAALVLFALDNATRDVPGLMAMMVCFAGLTAAHSEFIFHGSVFGGQIRAMIFLATFALALRFPFITSETTSDRAYSKAPSVEGTTISGKL